MKIRIMSLGYKFILLGSIFILSSSYPLATANVPEKQCKPDPEECIGTVDECEKVQTCYNGKCTKSGICECFSCFHGDSCDKYNDEDGPTFNKKSDMISIFGEEKGTIYQASATDPDRDTQCLKEDINDKCPCGNITYGILNDVDNNFSIDPATGNMFIKNPELIESGETHQLTLLAQGSLANGSLSTQQDTMELTISVLEPDEEENSVRRKRDAAGTTEESTTIVLEKLTDPSATTTKLGDKIEYKMEIWVPKLGTDMDLVVEIFTSDPQTKQASFALMKPKIDTGSKVKLSAGKPEPKMDTNAFFTTVYDRATMDFGNVNSESDGTGGFSKTDSLITITFKTITITSNATDTGPYYVTAGAEYFNHKFVWVGQSELTHDTTEVNFETMATLTGPDTINTDSFATYSVESTIAGPVPDVTFAAFLTAGDEDVISIGSIGATTLGSEFSANLDFAADRSLTETTYAYSVTKNSIISSSFNVPFIASPVVTDTTNSKISWIFSVWAIKGIVSSVLPVKLGIAMQLGEDKIWTGVKTLTLTDNAAAGSGTLTFSSADPLTADAIPPGGTAIVRAKFKLTSGGLQPLKLKITPSDVNSISICETRTTLRGFNIPYIPHPNASAVLDEATGVVEIDLKNIGNTGQITEDAGQNKDVNEFWFEIGVKALKDAADADYTVDVEAGGTTKTATIKVAASAQATEDVAVTIGASLGSTDMLAGWLTGGAAAIDITATFPPKLAVTEMTVEGTGMLTNFDFDIRVCRIDISHQGSAIPCAGRGPQEFKKTADTRKYDDYVIWDVGSMCSVDRNEAGKENATYDNKITYTVSYEIPLKETVKTTDYSLSAGLKLGAEKIWAGQVPFTPSLTKVASYSGVIQPLLSVKGGKADVPADKVNIATFYLKLPPKAHGVLLLEVEVDPLKLIICPLKIRFGGGMPCEDDQPFKKWDEKDPTTLNYDHDDSTKDRGAVKAILDLKNVHNIGTTPLVSSNVFDNNAIEVLVPVYVMDSGTVTLTVTGNPGGITPALSKAHSLTVSGSATQSTTADVELSMKEDPDFPGYQTGVGSVVLVTATFDKTNKEFYTKDFVLEVYNDGAKKFNVCCAAIYDLGTNLPCINASKVEWEQIPDAAVDADGNPIMSKLEIKIPVVCQYEIESILDESNQITFQVGYKVTEDGNPVEIKATAKFNGGTKDSAPFTPTKKVIAPTEPDTDGAVKLLDDSDDNGVLGEKFEVNIGQWVWLRFSILTVSGTRAQYQAAVFGRVTDSRAEVTVHDIRVVETGINVVCVNDAHEYEIIIGKANDTLPTSQNNMLLVKFGTILNTGVAKRIVGEIPDDNAIVLEALVQITDHPLNTDAKDLLIDVGGMMGKQIIITQQAVTVKRKADDMAIITVEMTYNNESSDPFKKNDEVILKALLRHENTSSREPTPGYLRFIWGPYMKFKDILSNESYTTLVNGTTYMDVEFDSIYFGDYISVNLTLETDPDEFRKPGSGEINAISIVRPVCKFESQTIPGGTSPPATSPPKLYYFCGEIAHVAYKVDAPECYDDLEFDQLDDNCIIASTAADASRAPEKSKTDGWSPAYSGSKSTDHLIVDFKKLVRVSRVKVTVGSHAETGNKVTKFKIEAGASEYGFQTPQTLAVTGDGTVDLNPPVVGRFIRFTIVETEDAANKYVDVKLAFFGCPQGTDLAANCNFEQKTRTGVDWRHIAIDPNTNILYYCFYSEKKKHMNCFCTPDGTKWREMPYYIGYMKGHEGGKMFAEDLKRTTSLSSTDCYHWSVEDTPPTAPAGVSEVPGTKDFSPITASGWTAEPKGISKGGALKAKWFECCT